METDHEIISAVILILRLIQKGQLSVPDESKRIITGQPLRGLSLPWKSVSSIALVKAFFFFFFQSKSIDIFSYFSTKTCCGYSLEAPLRGASNEYPQQMFLWRNKKNIYQIPSLI